MKTFTSTQWRHGAQEIFKTVAKERKVIINHARYPELIFELSARERRKENLHEFMAKHREDNDER